MSEEFFSKIRKEIEEQRRVLSTFATNTDVSQNDKAILLKAEYYLLRLSRVLYVNKVNSTDFRIKESQNAFPELHGKTKSTFLRNQYEVIMRKLAMIQSELASISVCKNNGSRERG
jgi:ATP-dependent Lon protease